MLVVVGVGPEMIDISEESAESFHLETKGMSSEEVDVLTGSSRSLVMIFEA
jgi:hypothetical protein